MIANELVVIKEKIECPVAWWLPYPDPEGSVLSATPEEGYEPLYAHPDYDRAALECKLHPESAFGLAELIAHVACIADHMKVGLPQGNYVQAQLHLLAIEIATSLARVDELYPPEEE